MKKRIADARKRLLKDKKYDPEQIGHWQILGEDQSYGGMFDRPIIEKLGIVHGKYKNAVEYALKLPGFFSWGWGGYIMAYQVPKIKKV